jgi:hypothetical protein
VRRFTLQIGQYRATIQRDPAHNLHQREMLRFAANTFHR